MVPSPFAGHDALLVHAQALDGDDLVVVVEELCLHGGVGHVEEHEDGEGDGDDAEEEEDDLVLLELGGDVAEAVGDETAELGLC